MQFRRAKSKIDKAVFSGGAEDEMGRNEEREMERQTETQRGTAAERCLMLYVLFGTFCSVSITTERSFSIFQKDTLSHFYAERNGCWERIRGVLGASIYDVH